MSERDDSFSEEKQSPASPSLTTTLRDSLKIFLRNKRIFLPIFAFLTLPLSFLLFSLSISSRPLKDEIYHLEALASLAHTRFEARHVWQESRSDAISLLRLKSLFFLPSFLLSLLAAVTAVTSAFHSYHGRRTSLLTAISAVKHTWKRVCVTTIVVYGVLLLYALVPYFLAAVFTSEPGLRLVVVVMGSGFQVYLMGIMGVALVVSIVEENFGWGAIRVGLKLMAGRRFCGWVLSGLFVVLSGLIGYSWEGLMEDEDWSRPSWWGLMIGAWDRVALVSLYGAEMLWCYMVTTVFYCESKRRHKAQDETLVTV